MKPLRGHEIRPDEAQSNRRLFGALTNGQRVVPSTGFEKASSR
jgi:hypothetical protein